MTDVTTEPTPTPAKLSATPLAHEIEFLAVRAAASGTRLANRGLAPLGLKVRSYSVLSLACGEVAPSQRLLAEYLDLDPSQIVALVDGLEADGLVTRVVDVSDRRTKAVQATAAGRALQRRAAEATKHAESAALASLSSAQRETLTGLLRRIVFDVGAAD